MGKYNELVISFIYLPIYKDALDLSEHLTIANTTPDFLHYPRHGWARVLVRNAPATAKGDAGAGCQGIYIPQRSKHQNLAVAGG
jgi:hypothetical protein